MKEHLLRFRTICAILHTKMTKEEIRIIVGISAPTLFKFLNDPLETITMRASILALIQNFNKSHIETLSIEKEKEWRIKEKELQIKEPLAVEENHVIEFTKNPNDSREFIVRKPSKIGEDSPTCSESFWSLMAKVRERLPEGVIVNITITK